MTNKINNKKRECFFITKEQHDFLRKEADKLEISMGELVRRSLDHSLKFIDKSKINLFSILKQLLETNSPSKYVLLLTDLQIDMLKRKEHAIITEPEVVELLAIVQEKVRQKSEQGRKGVKIKDLEAIWQLSQQMGK